MQFFSYLTDEDVEYVHSASLEILEEVGLLVRNEKARNRCAEHGCVVDHETEMVQLPAHVVEKYRAMTPPTITLRGRDPKYDLTFPRELPVIATASSAPDIVDPVTGKARRATSDDIANIAHLVNELPGFDMFSISTLADDAPTGQFNLSRFYPALKNCLKPVRTSVLDVEEAKQILKLGELIAGSPEAFWERPFINFGYCAIVSPLTMDFDSTENLMFFAENGVTAYGTIAPMGGLSTPLSLSGMLTIMNAEWLAACTLAQMSKAGTEQIYNFLPVFADMRDGAYAPGAIEIGMMNSAVCQMARFYNVPAGGYLGLTNSKTPDAQAGFEKGMSPLLGAASGVDFIVMGGLQDALMTFDFGQLTIDNEIAQMIKKVRGGFGFSKESASLAEIKKTGAAGMFAANPATLERMHTATFMPELADRKLREQWEDEGASTIQQRALNKALDILSTANPAAFDLETDARIRREFEGIVAGDSQVPEGWVPFDFGIEVITRKKRVNRRRKQA
ncbi:MAG: trimethylamine methyltransferase [Rhodospirillales bacterium]|jgi:trimethylamine---corrinoid protein Co-methyltransferase|nr:trimethylamine methyltransferase [Rhodospirillales bacterium]MBT4040517.1 trimethylamine methyltransferase [Rhodospirillales bacterium]MBT4626464.1 trimethylamine methyltransferase [Rhodospirillales bacterium]MBT5350853.1 trimethylamine methyltransferase [Rhodospirillales bacterium]MBT5520707.1 trimethylamine methyltransferase [Rhodospirillales bacterium]